MDEMMAVCQNNPVEKDIAVNKISSELMLIMEDSWWIQWDLINNSLFRIGLNFPIIIFF